MFNVFLLHLYIYSRENQSLMFSFSLSPSRFSLSLGSDKLDIEKTDKQVGSNLLSRKYE